MSWNTPPNLELHRSTEVSPACDACRRLNLRCDEKRKNLEKACKSCDEAGRECVTGGGQALEDSIPLLRRNRTTHKVADFDELFNQLRITHNSKDLFSSIIKGFVKEREDVRMWLRDVNDPHHIRRTSMEFASDYVTELKICQDWWRMAVFDRLEEEQELHILDAIFTKMRKIHYDYPEEVANGAPVSPAWSVNSIYSEEEASAVDFINKVRWERGLADHVEERQARGKHLEGRDAAARD